MSYHVGSFEYSKAQTSLVGGKGANLIWLKENKIATADFIIASTESYLYWKSHGSLPGNLLGKINIWLSKAEQKYFAVRSSFALEDGVKDSFAGMMETYLYVTKDEIKEKIIECFKSSENKRVQEYLNQKNITDTSAAAVVIQEMIESEVSGVLFSRSPLGNSSYIEIDAAWGLGEGVVAGTVEVDHFSLTRFGEMQSQKIEVKEKLVEFDSNLKKVQINNVPEEKKNISCLSEEMAKNLTNEAVKLEILYKKPVDIEWAIYKNKIYILQVRPITQSFPKLIYYTDINLIESYPGISSPFTGSIIPKLYTKVFCEAADYFGFSKKRLKELTPIYDHLIQDINHHLYYNLNSYYTALYSLPGGDKNILNWHKMIGGSADGIPNQISVTPFSLFERASCIFNIVKIFLMKKFYLGRFYKKSEKTRLKYKDKIDNASSLEESVDILINMISDVKGFGLTIINDLHIMILLGMVEKNITNPEELAQILKTDGDLESLKPILGLKEFFSTSKEMPNFIEQFKKEAKEEFITYPEIFKKLENEFPKEIEALKKYLKNFGSRSFEELKFESLSFEESPLIFSEFVSWYYGSEVSSDNSEKEEVTKKPPTLLVKALYSCIEDREHSRLVRGQFYALIRKAFLKSIEFLRKDDQFKDFQSSDFFSLTYDDLIFFNNKKISIQDFKQAINERKSWKEKIVEFPEFYCSEENQQEHSFVREQASDDEQSTSDLKGLGVSNGKITGKALVLKSPQEVYQYKNLSEYILITHTTDPAWVFIMAQCKGLISEKGSLLSHTAIIGRELAIPTIVGVKNITKQIKTNTIIEIDGTSGVINLR